MYSLELDVLAEVPAAGISVDPPASTLVAGEQGAQIADDEPLSPDFRKLRGRKKLVVIRKHQDKENENSNLA
jgi:hypothetical protein